jgi:cell division protein FtsI/penicillin-binding protein 2
LEQTSKPLAIRWSSLATVRSGMWQVVNSPNGSGRRARLDMVEVAGKTGSAMLGSETYAWFAAFAPFDAPRLAIAVVVEHAQTGGLDAAPVAQHAFASYFDVEMAGLTNRPVDMSTITD